MVIEVPEPDVEAAGEEDAKYLQETQATPNRSHHQQVSSQLLLQTVDAALKHTQTLESDARVDIVSNITTI